MWGEPANELVADFFEKKKRRGKRNKTDEVRWIKPDRSIGFSPSGTARISGAMPAVILSYRRVYIVTRARARNTALRKRATRTTGIYSAAEFTIAFIPADDRFR